MSEPFLDYAVFRQEAEPAYAALVTLSHWASSNLEKRLVELVKVRVSQINQCAFCLQFHLNLARQAGVEPSKLDLVATWREAHVFDTREKAALAFAESITRMGEDAAAASAAPRLNKAFTRDEILHLTVVVGIINQWNRIAVALGFTPPPRS